MAVEMYDPEVVDAIKHKLVDVIYPSGQGYDDSSPWLPVNQLPLWIYWGIYDTVNRLNVTDAAFLVTFGLYINYHQSDLDHAQNAISWLLDGLAEIQKYGYSNNVNDSMIRFTYLLLRNQQISYTEAAIFASWTLKKQFSTDAWRKRIARFVDVNGLSPVQAPRGRPKKGDE